MLAGVLVLAFAGIAVAASGPAKVKLRKTSIGKILTNRPGLTLYMFSRDTRNHDKCMGIRFCAMTWPALTTKGKPVAGPGVKASLLGKINIGHGKSQVTYAGHPLYVYSGDCCAGEVLYVGTPMFGGTWNAISAAGKTVK